MYGITLASKPDRHSILQEFPRFNINEVSHVPNPFTKHMHHLSPDYIKLNVDNYKESYLECNKSLGNQIKKIAFLSTSKLTASSNLAIYIIR